VSRQKFNVNTAKDYGSLGYRGQKSPADTLTGALRDYMKIVQERTVDRVFLGKNRGEANQIPLYFCKDGKKRLLGDF
jgi:hypothetical protein